MASIASGLFVLSTPATSTGSDRYKGSFRSATNGQKHAVDVFLPVSVRQEGNLSGDGSGRVFLSLSTGVGGAYAPTALCADITLLKRSKGPSGGDKYTGQFRGRTESKEGIALYIPQEFSRDAGVVRQRLSLTVETDPRAVRAEGERQSAASSSSSSAPPPADHQAQYLASGQFTLHSAAKRSGGDRYKGEIALSTTQHKFPMDIYIPQTLSRIGDLSRPKQVLRIAFHAPDQMARGRVLLRLARPAQSSGGDRFEGALEGSSAADKVTVYLPQGLSRTGSGPIRAVVMSVGGGSSSAPPLRAAVQTARGSGGRAVKRSRSESFSEESEDESSDSTYSGGGSSSEGHSDDSFSGSGSDNSDESAASDSSSSDSGGSGGGRRAPVRRSDRRGAKAAPCSGGRAAPVGRTAQQSRPARQSVRKRKAVEVSSDDGDEDVLKAMSSGGERQADDGRSGTAESNHRPPATVNTFEEELIDDSSNLLPSRYRRRRVIDDSDDEGDGADVGCIGGPAVAVSTGAEQTVDEQQSDSYRLLIL